jgi:uncharacterized protein YecT (DUF1311 family)
MNHATCARAITAVAAILCSAAASAASFDCGRARTQMERAICASPELSALDERMAASYERASKALSPAGARELKASQLAWLRYARQACYPDGKPQRGVEGCVHFELERRANALDVAGRPIGTLVLTRVDRWEVLPAPADDDTGGHGGLVMHHVGYPRMDDASSGAIAWNAALSQGMPDTTPSDDDDSTDLDVDYDIGCANAHLLSIEWTTYQYAHGAAHGMYGRSSETTVFAPGSRALEASDLFTAGADWETRVPALFWQAYLRGEKADKDDKEVAQAIHDAAVDPTRWLVTPAGLRIAFSAYEAGSYASDPGPLVVSWQQLRPLLASGVVPTCSVTSFAADAATGSGR